MSRPLRTAATLVAISMLLLSATALRAATGGPDAAGYTWADSDESGLDLGYPPFTATDIRTPGFSGDEKVWQLALPASAFPTGPLADTRGQNAAVRKGVDVAAFKHHQRVGFVTHCGFTADQKGIATEERD